MSAFFFFGGVGPAERMCPEVEHLSSLGSVLRILKCTERFVMLKTRGCPISCAVEAIPNGEMRQGFRADATSRTMKMTIQGDPALPPGRDAGFAFASARVL